MSVTTDDYRAWLWAYPRAWRKKHGEALTGILAESAVSGDTPGIVDWLNLARSGIATRVHTYLSGLGERYGEALGLLRSGLARAAAPAIVSAFVLLVVDLANGLAGTRSSVGYAAHTGSIWWSSSTFDEPRPFYVMGFAVLLVSLLALVGLCAGRRRLAQFACAIGASFGILVWTARVLAGQGNLINDLTPAPTTGLVAGLLLLVGLALPAEAGVTRGLAVFGVGATLVLAFERGLFGGAIDLGFLNGAALPIGGALTSCYLILIGCWFVAAARSRVDALAAVALLAVCWRAGLNSGAREFEDVVAGRLLLEGLATVAFALLAVTLIAGRSAPRKLETS